MGCWNGTCGASQLPIHSGDPVVGFLLEFSGGMPSLNGYCYSTSVASPLFVPIVGKYNDYGSIEEIETGSEILYDFVTEERTIKLSEDRYDDKVEDVPTMVDAVERGRFSYNWHPEFGKGKIGLIMFHKHVFDDLVASIGGRIPYGKDKPLLELVRASLSTKVDNLINPPSDRIEAMMARTNGRIFEGSEQGFYNKFMLETYIKYIEEGKRSKEDLVNCLANHDLIQEAMGLLRKLWIPQCGAGSQSTEYRLHKVLFDASRKVIREYHEEVGRKAIRIYTEETLFRY